LLSLRCSTVVCTASPRLLAVVMPPRTPSKRKATHPPPEDSSSEEPEVSESESEETDNDPAIGTPSGSHASTVIDTPTRNATAARSTAALRNLRRAQRVPRPLRPEPYLRHSGWCMHCFRTFVDNWDPSGPPVIPCLDDGMSSKKCKQCASRGKNCEPVSYVPL
jgi:hypothetical protein